MRNLNLIASECMAELDTLNIKYGCISAFKVNTRTKTRFGACEKTENTFVIEIASFLLDEKTDITVLKNTIHHELLHTCDGCMNHGAKWKALAEQVNKAYGYQIQRLSSESEEAKVYRSQSIVKPKMKYRFKCKNCGLIVERSRKSNFTAHPEQYMCPDCKGDFKRIF